MNCRNCGAAMELFARRSYYFCRYCGSFEFIAGGSDAGLTVLDPSAGVACPVCAAPLATALLDAAATVRHCQQCAGLLIRCADFADAVARRRARETAPPAAPVPLDPRELQRQVNCPSCAVRMEVHPYYGPGNVVIDTCARCEVVWLDAGELKQITEAPGPDRVSAWRPR